MAFTFKGQQVDNINYNGQPLDKLQFNGVTVWEKAQLWKGLKFTANENSSKIAITRVGGTNLFSLSTVEYSKDNGSTWNTWAITGSISTVITLNAGESICVRSTNSHWGATGSYWKFNISAGSIAASGNIMSIIDKSNFDTLTTFNGATYVFGRLFLDQTRLTSAPELPATTLSNYCYYYMFSGCTGLTKSPEIPNAKTADRCCSYMFNGCKNLKTITTYVTTLTGTFPFAMWVNGVSASGTFYNLGKASFSTGESGIPSGWTVKTSK